MKINHNEMSAFASRMEGINTGNMTKSMEKLSSGSKINRAGDDAANMAVSEKMRSQIKGLNQASRNVSNGISMIQTTEGYLQETTDIIQRIRELAVQAANGVYSDEDRMQIQVEVSQLVAEVDRIASQATFNGMNILTGRFEENEALTIHLGPNVDNNIQLNIFNASASALGLTGSQGSDEQISISDAEQANITIAIVDAALSKVNAQRANLGAFQNRMEIAVKGINVASENMQAAESTIRDTDMASEMVEYTKNAVLQNASISMLAQANNSSNLVLKLLEP